MGYTFVLDDCGLYRTTSGRPPNSGPWQVLGRDGEWARSTGPGFSGGGYPDPAWMVWMVARRHVGSEEVALRALGWEERGPPDVPRIRSEDPKLVARVRADVETDWRAAGRDDDLTRDAGGVLWNEVERRLRERRQPDP